MNYKVIIVGGGSAGLLLAVSLLKGDNRLKGEDILILEKNDRVGKKLIATGNGQGNLSNTFISRENYYGNSNFINQFLSFNSQNDIIKYLNSLGVFTTCDNEGRIYPISRQASAVLDVLRSHILTGGVTEKVNSEVKSIKFKNESYQVCTSDGIYCAKKVVLAVGGSSAKQFGTDGSSYNLATNFGHKLTSLYPSLVQLKTNLDYTRGLKGIKEVAKVTALVDGKIAKSATGDVLFTDFGVSGDAIFKISASVAGKTDAKLKIEFLPDLSEEQVENLLMAQQEACPLYSENPFVTILNKRVGSAVYKRAKSSEPKLLAKAVKNFNLNITGSLGFNNAQVTRGGIDTRDINPVTFESKLAKGLYILGEMLDIDGDCGGYNLTFAFLSALMCAQDIKNCNL